MVGYTLPSQILDRVGISKFRIYASANNLFTFTNTQVWILKLAPVVRSKLASTAASTHLQNLQPGHQRDILMKHMTTPSLTGALA